MENYTKFNSSSPADREQQFTKFIFEEFVAKDIPILILSRDSSEVTITKILLGGNVEKDVQSLSKAPIFLYTIQETCSQEALKASLDNILKEKKIESIAIYGPINNAHLNVIKGNFSQVYHY